MKRFTHLLATGLAFSWSLVAGDGGYVALGSLSIQAWNAGSKQGAERQYVFSAEVNGCAWRIITAIEGSTDRFQKAFQDGEMYSLFEMGPRPGNGGRGFAPAMANSLREGGIVRRNYPLGDGSAIEYVWLAYASSCYFAEAASNSQLHPVYPLDDPFLEKDGFTVTGSWVLETSSGLPRQINYLNDGYLRFWDQETKKHEMSRYSPPWDTGFTNATFSVEASTNLGGMMIPARARFTRFYINENKIYPLTTIDLQTTGAVSRSSSGILRPEFSGVATIRDKRFASSNQIAPVNPLSYKIYDGEWLDTTQLAREYQHEARKLDRQRKVPTSN